MLLLLDDGYVLTDLPADGALPSQPSSTAPLAYNGEHILQALNRLIEQYRDKPRIRALLVLMSRQIQDMEDAAWQLLLERTIAAAIGVNLDVLGVIVGQERGDLSDESYRALIRARIKANRSAGSGSQIYDVATTAGATGLGLDVVAPGFVLYVQDPPGFSEYVLADLVHDASAASFGRHVWIALADVSTQMRFGDADDYPEFDVGTGLDDATSPGVGTGTLGSAI